MSAHHITLQSSVGDFAPAFVKRLPPLEMAMRDHGLDPSAFVIARNLARSPHLPIFNRPDGNLLEYTAFLKGRSFTVTQDNETICASSNISTNLAPEPRDDPHSLMHKLQSEEQKLESLFARVGRWLNKPI